MSIIQLSIEGADSAHLLKIRRQSSRVWMFPDGLARSVTMSGWHWHAYRKLVPAHYKDGFAADCFEFAQIQFSQQQDNPDSIFDLDFESWIQKAIQDMIRMDRRLQQPRANNNGFYDLAFID